jgi:transposase
MNQLHVSLQHSIATLAAKGWSARKIARELGVHRETVGRYLQPVKADSNPAIPPTGSADPSHPKPAILPAGSEDDSVSKPVTPKTIRFQNRSLCPPGPKRVAPVNAPR